MFEKLFITHKACQMLVHEASEYIDAMRGVVDDFNAENGTDYNTNSVLRAFANTVNNDGD